MVREVWRSYSANPGYRSACTRVLVVPLGALQHGGMHVDDVVTNFDAGVGVGLQVPVPGGVIVAPVVRREHEIPFTVGQIHHDVGPRLTALCAHGVHDDHRRALEGSADPTVISAELRDVVCIEVVAIAHFGSPHLD